jgi:hypothetical protein
MSGAIVQMGLAGLHCSGYSHTPTEQYGTAPNRCAIEAFNRGVLAFRSTQRQLIGKAKFCTVPFQHEAPEAYAYCQSRTRARQEYMVDLNAGRLSGGAIEAVGKVVAERMFPCVARGKAGSWLAWCSPIATQNRS